MPRRGPSSSSYGRACIGCFKCKCKCILRPDGDGCERCHRLKKQCQSADAIRRRTLGKVDSHARIADLEGKLDSLVSLLRSRKVLDSGAEVLPLRRTPFGEREFRHDSEDSSPSSEPETSRPRRTTVFPIPTTADGPERSPTASWNAPLELFRSRMLPYFPLLHLPASLTAEQLQTERPYLFKAVLCIASPSPHERKKRATELRRVLCEAAFLRQPAEVESANTGRTIDLLLSLLVYIAWGWDHIRSGGSLSRLMMLAMSLVGEMRLDKLIPSDAHAFQLFHPGFQTPPGTGDAAMSPELVLELQRALVGCFLLSCYVSTYFGEVEALRYTPKIEAALDALSSNSVCTTDAVLVLQVRLQLLSKRAAGARASPTGTEEGSDPKYIAPLLRQLQELRPSISRATPDSPLAPTARLSNRILTAQSHYLESDAIGDMYSSLAGTVLGHLTIESLSYLRQGVSAIEACTSKLLAPSATHFLGISFIQWVQLTRCVVVLHHLYLLRDPGWDLRAVRETVNPAVLLDHMVEKLEKTAREAGEQEQTDVFTQLAHVTRIFGTSVQGSNVQPDQGSSSEDSARNTVSIAPQKGYFRNPRFWMEGYFDEAGYSWAG